MTEQERFKWLKKVSGIEAPTPEEVSEKSKAVFMSMGLDEVEAKRRAADLVTLCNDLASFNTGRDDLYGFLKQQEDRK